MRRLIACVLMAAMLAPLGGCWNYRGLDEIMIVMGSAIDKEQGSENYRITYEIIDLNKPVKAQGINTVIVSSEGKTKFEAARNAKKKVSNKLYFGHTQVFVISEEIARNEEIGGIIDFLLRDAETRETACLVVLRGKTAREIFETKSLSNIAVSNEIHDIISNDQKITSSTLRVPIYEIFNTLKSEGKALVLPAFHRVDNNGETVNEANGIAVFKEEKLAGFLTPEETKYFLIATNKTKGGILPIASEKSGHADAALEISKNKTKLSFTARGDKVKVKIKTETIVYLGEILKDINTTDLAKIAELQDIAEKKLEANIMSVIKKTQSEFGADIFGFGRMIRKKDFKLWNRLKDNWDEQFRSLKVEVRSDVKIVNTAYLMKT
ncbi:MAG: Ger(x)C family spore germination protein [Clostridiales bacterium]|nr:Ger(x)C family spore germination protein [Clostridiales bacterium]